MIFFIVAERYFITFAQKKQYESYFFIDNS